METVNPKMKPLIKFIPALVYGLLLFAAAGGRILFFGFTNLTDSAVVELDGLKILLDRCVYLFGVISALLMWPKSRSRALLAIGLLVWRGIGTPTWQGALLVDLILLSSVSGICSEKENGNLWLISHGVYVLILLLLLLTGRVTEVFTHPGKHIWIFTQGRSLGMGHPNSIALFLVSTFLMIWYLYIPKKWYFSFPFFWIGAFLVFGLTLCRTLAVLLLLFPFLAALIAFISGTKRAPLLQGTAVFPLLIITAAVVIGMSASSLQPYFTDGAFWVRFTDFNILRESGLTLFGAYPVRFGYFDNFYIWMLMYAGIVPTAAVIVLYIWMLYVLARRNNAGLLSLAILFLFYGFMENAVAYAFYFFVPLLAFSGSSPAEMQT